MAQPHVVTPGEPIRLADYDPNDAGRAPPSVMT